MILFKRMLWIASVWRLNLWHRYFDWANGFLFTNQFVFSISIQISQMSTGFHTIFWHSCHICFTQIKLNVFTIGSKYQSPKENFVHESIITYYVNKYIQIHIYKSPYANVMEKRGSRHLLLWRLSLLQMRRD